MMYVVCYDISDDRARDRASRVLLGYGSRIQESVFECILDDELVTRMLAALSRVGLDTADKVRVYKICARCVREIAIYGAGDVTAAEPDFYFL